MRRLIGGSFALLLLAACGAVGGAPNFVQKYGVVDAPCVTSKVPAHCTAHVWLVNQGGNGIGHAQVEVPMGDSTASSPARLAVASCAMPIPQTSAGGYAELTCDFDLLPGQKVSAAPYVSKVDYALPYGGSSPAGQTRGIATIVLATAAALVAAAAIVMAITRRQVVAGTLPETGAPTATSRARADDDEDDDKW